MKMPPRDRDKEPTGGFVPIGSDIDAAREMAYSVSEMLGAMFDAETKWPPKRLDGMEFNLKYAARQDFDSNNSQEIDMPNLESALGYIAGTDRGFIRITAHLPEEGRYRLVVVDLLSDEIAGIDLNDEETVRYFENLIKKKILHKVPR